MTRVNPWLSGYFGQARAINALDEQLGRERDASRRTATRLHTELLAIRDRAAQVDGRMDVIISWIDLRFQLLEFEEFSVRKAVRKLVRDTVASRKTSAAIGDVPGYWLPPAVVGTLSAAGAEAVVDFDADRSAALTAAIERDAVRTNLFGFAMGVGARWPSVVEPTASWLLTAAPDFGIAPPGRVADGWRAVWRSTGQGRCGPVARALLSSRLADLLDPANLDQPELDRWDRAIEHFGTGTTSITEALDALRTHLTAVEADQDTDDGSRWERYLQELVDEPSPNERPLVQRLDDLHRIDGRPQLAVPSWAEGVGTVPELIRHDLFAPRGPIALRQLAFEAALPLIRDRLAGLSAHEPAPATTTVHFVGRAITVTAEGADAAAVERAERSGDAVAGPSSGGYLALGAALAAGSLLLMLLGIGILAVLLLLGVGAVVVSWSRADRSARASAARNRELHARLHADLARARSECVARDARLIDQHRVDQLAIERFSTELEDAWSRR